MEIHTYKKVFYEQGNKSGKLLAKAFQATHTNSTIYHIKATDGSLSYSNKDIASQTILYKTI